MGIAFRTPTAVPDRRFRSAVFLLGFLALAGCDREPARDGPAESDAAGAADPVEGTEDGGLPISASVSADSASSTTGPPGGPAADSSSRDAREASRVVENYYAAIDAGDYERAFEYWGDSGRASGQSYLEFVSGFAGTAGVTVSIGEGGRVEGAAGSRYIEIPVDVTATTKKGGRQRFQGSYTLRRTVVDGATPEQRRWHIQDAELRELR